MSVCFVCCVFVNCLVKQFAMCLGVVANMYDLSDLPLMLAIVNGEPVWCLMTQKIINSLTTIIVSILFPLARFQCPTIISNCHGRVGDC